MIREDSGRGSIFLEFHSHQELVFEAIEHSEKFLIKFITESEAIGIGKITRAV